jgi:hypothetical protein
MKGGERKVRKKEVREDILRRGKEKLTKEE